MATPQRVTVVEDENAAFGVARLLLRRAGGPGKGGAVTWELCYGGVPVAAGSHGPDQDVVFTEIASIEPAMDSSGFTITARYADGDQCVIAAVCVRPARPPTRAEATARARWPGARHQQAAPGPGRLFLAGTRDISLPPPASPQGEPGRPRSVRVYQHFSVLLAHRRQIMREPAAASTGPAPVARS